MGIGMSSNKMLPVTAQQPNEGELNVLTMSGEQILNLISATHGHDENFDADFVFVVVKNILKRATHFVDNVLQVCMCLPSFNSS
jgi:hypothetical protein